MPETATVDVPATPPDQQVPAPGIAPADTPASPEPAPEPAGDQPAPDGGTEDADQDVDPKELVRAAVKALGIEAKDLTGILLDVVDGADIADHPKIREAQRAAEQRAIEQSRQTDKDLATREEAFTTLEAAGSDADTWLANRLGQFDRLKDIDPDEALKLVSGPAYAQAMINLKSGALATAARGQMRVADQLFEKHAETIGELTPEERQLRAEARRADAQSGNSTKSMELLTDLLVARVAAKTAAEVTPKAEAAGARKSASTAESLALLAKIAEAAGMAPPAINGKKPASGLDTSDDARKQRIAWGGTNGIPAATPEDKAWQAEQRRRAGV